jgi:hypothetical protein
MVSENVYDYATDKQFRVWAEAQSVRQYKQIYLEMHMRQMETIYWKHGTCACPRMQGRPAIV